MNEKKIAAMAGFVALGLSPSFLDWKQSPDDRWKFIGFYIIALSLFYYGVLSG